MKEKYFSLLNINHDEQERFARVLKTYFPWLGTEEEADGSDTIAELVELYESLT